MADALFPNGGVGRAAVRFDAQISISTFYVDNTPPPPPSEVRAPWCFQDHLGRLHTAHKDKTTGKIRYRRSDSTTLPFVVDVLATTGSGDTWPRMAVDFNGRILLVFERNSSAFLAFSDDDGETFSEPFELIVGGRRPTVVVGHYGEIVYAALVSVPVIGRHIWCRYQDPGEVEPGPPVLLLTTHPQTGAITPVADDSFQFAFGFDGPGTCILHVRIGTEDATSIWEGNDGFRSLRRVSPVP